MAVSKRIRFEVLRRDEYTCRYCRSRENQLTVDHVTPVALGGTDDPSNLVAACKACNSGKSSASPDASLVADVRDDAIRHAELIKQAYAVLVDQMYKRDEYVDEFIEAWNEYSPEPDRVWALPTGFEETIGRWYRMGVPIELVADAARRATKTGKKMHGTDGRFKYMCGIVWGQVHAVSEAGFDKASLDGAYMTCSSLTDERIEAYQTGWRRGLRCGIAQGVSAAWLSHASPVAAAVDRPAHGSYVSERGCSGEEFEARDLQGAL